MNEGQSVTLEANTGLLVRRAGEPLIALGLLEDANVRERVMRAMDEARDRPLFSIEFADGAAMGLNLRFGDAEVVLVRPAQPRAALLDFIVAVPFAADILEQILNDPYTGITVADHEARMLYMSPVHEIYLGLPRGGAIGWPADRAIPNSRLGIVAQSGKAEIGKPLKLDNDVTRVVSRRPIWKNGKVVGAVGQVMFRDAEAVSQMAAEMTQLRSQLAFYRQELDDLRVAREAMAELVGESQAVQRLRDDIARVAKLDVPVLIIGESGTGKELVARAIHRLGRPEHVLVSMNLAAIPESLVESELFGHVAGAFTGSARQGRAGKLEMANDGTLFLDEVGDIPADIQIKLLRVLEDHVVERLGSHSAKRSSFRLVAATHRNMDELIRAGSFRHDLYYRISGVTLRVPPLRERLEDLPALLQHFVQSFCTRNGWALPAIEAQVTHYLADQEWPGNLRQLRHRVEEALVFSGPAALTLDAFRRNEATRTAAGAAPTEAGDPHARAVAMTSQAETASLPGAASLRAQQRAAAIKALRECEGNKQRAARQLGISRSYLYKLIGQDAGV
ncbi:hypothetical protein CAL29_07945 [Bordetella genomosp. 10]|uniref:Sigma-54 factor interaction domain-containing protein n=1 Tax=Bordetella genomosp. 10 TaxID=1416804 RepID=A0A261SMN1_9BORD|nr:sigma 54-interacting transcriptional regulator [Bordetella genomosp. 10]OZI38247.1 hypothetical protein CAL29_07945 [Bordetella genomosp. 10]